MTIDAAIDAGSEGGPNIMRLNAYLNYGGNCAEAFRFYEQNLGGKITMIMTHGQMPGPDNADPAWKDKVLHARLELGGTAIYGADIPSPPFEPMRSAYLSLAVDSIEEAERVYALLIEGGQVFMPMAETFFAHRFAMLRDKFGTSWMLLNEKPMPQG
jgi:PhnB protein